jgi:hypothetical protein
MRNGVLMLDVYSSIERGCMVNSDSTQLVYEGIPLPGLMDGYGIIANNIIDMVCNDFQCKSPANSHQTCFEYLMTLSDDKQVISQPPIPMRYGSMVICMVLHSHHLSLIFMIA